jgi:hypothetical protein
LPALQGHYPCRAASEQIRIHGGQDGGFAVGRGSRYLEHMQSLHQVIPPRDACDHIPDGVPEPQADHCQECGSGFNLRLCATCGHVGCCESQRGDARAHALSEGHPVIYQMPAPQGFVWCYEDRRYVG